MNPFKLLLFVCAILFIVLSSCQSSDLKKQDKNRGAIISYENIGKITPKNSSEMTKSPFGIPAGTLEDSLVAKAAKIGERRYPSHSSSHDHRGSAPWWLNIQAKWLLRQSFVDTYFCKVTLSNYFKLVHTDGRGDKPVRSNLRPIYSIFGYPEGGGSRIKTKGVNEKCLLTNPDFEEKPAFLCVQNLCAVWKPEYKLNEVSYTTEVIDQGVFYGIGEEDNSFPSAPLVMTFSDKEVNNLVAWWLPWNAQEYLPELAKINIS